MFEFIKEEQLKEIAKAILNNQNYTFNQNGLDIQAESSDNGFSIQMSYSEPTEDLIKKERDEFQDWLKGLDDDLFLGVCESMGDVSSVSNCLNSDDLESVRSGIIKFKNYYVSYVQNKIDYYKKCLHNLPR